MSNDAVRAVGKLIGRSVSESAGDDNMDQDLREAALAAFKKSALGTQAEDANSAMR